MVPPTNQNSNFARKGPCRTIFDGSGDNDYDDDKDDDDNDDDDKTYDNIGCMLKERPLWGNS